MYSAGESTYEIAKICNVSPAAVRHSLLKYGTEMRSGAQTKTFNLPIVEILIKFDAGASCRELAKQYGYTVSGMSSILHRNSRKPIIPKTSNDWSFIHNNRQLFLYWLGWMLSDGCISYRKNGVRTTLTVHKNDSYINEFFRDAINCDRMLHCPRGKNISRLDANISRADADYLASWGLVPRKSLILKPTENLTELNRPDFMQMLSGYIEGDGTVRAGWVKSGKYKYYVLHIGITCGSATWLQWINYNLIGFGYKSRTIRPKKRKAKDWSCNNSNCYDYRISGSEAVSLASEILNCKYHLLGRKWDKTADFVL